MEGRDLYTWWLLDGQTHYLASRHLTRIGTQAPHTAAVNAVDAFLLRDANSGFRPSEGMIGPD